MNAFVIRPMPLLLWLLVKISNKSTAIEYKIALQRMLKNINGILYRAEKYENLNAHSQYIVGSAPYAAPLKVLGTCVFENLLLKSMFKITKTSIHLWFNSLSMHYTESFENLFLESIFLIVYWSKSMFKITKTFIPLWFNSLSMNYTEAF